MATSSIAGIGDVEHRELLATGLRAALSAGVLLAVYFLVPVGHLHTAHSLVRDVGVMARLGVATAVFIAVLLFEIRGITRAKHPMLRAGVAMAIVIPLFLIFFAWIYLNMSNSDAQTFGHGAMGHMTALYFTVTVFSTVGFGDITPNTDLARLVTTVQMLADLAVIAIVVRLIFGVANRSVAERAPPAPTGGAELATGATATPTVAGGPARPGSVRRPVPRCPDAGQPGHRAARRARSPSSRPPWAGSPARQLASAVSNAGAMGIIETSSGELDTIRDEIARMKDLTDKPFGVNIAQAFVADPTVIVDFVIAQGVRFVTTSAGSPTKYTAQLKDAGLTVFHVVPTLPAAAKAVDAGVDGLIVEGGEGGGFKNPRPVSTMVLLPSVTAAFDLPVIAAGGFLDGPPWPPPWPSGPKASSSARRMLSSVESPVHQNWKQAIIDAAETDTVFLNSHTSPALRALRTAGHRAPRVRPRPQRHGVVRQRAATSTSAATSRPASPSAVRWRVASRQPAGGRDHPGCAEGCEATLADLSRRYVG